jgi:hypothetical protein
MVKHRWHYNSIEINSLKSASGVFNNPYGFIYLIRFSDSTYYIGKKAFYNTIAKRQLKKGVRESVIAVKSRNIEGKRVKFDIIKKESNWKTYIGSKPYLKNKDYMEKCILAFAENKRELTYLEAKYQFKYDCLEDKDCLNDNILGKFFRKKSL